MIKKVVKMPIPEEISDKGGAMVRFVEQTTIPLETTVREAIDGLYVIGQEALVKSNFFGLFRSMAAGVSRDAKPRKLADFLTVTPVIKGPIDLDRGFDPEVNEIRIVARLMNEMEIDITNWTFEDVTPGRKSITIESIKGVDMNLVDAMHNVEINGRGLAADHVVECAIEGGEVVRIDPKLVTGDVSRMDIAAAAFKPFAKAENRGKKLTITIRGNFAKASKVVTISAIPEPKIVKVMGETSGKEDVLDTFYDKAIIEVEGVDLATAKVNLKLFSENGNMLAETDYDGQYIQHEILSPNKIAVKSIANPTREPESVWVMKNKSVFVNVILENGTALTHKIVIENE